MNITSNSPTQFRVRLDPEFLARIDQLVSARLVRSRGAFVTAACAAHLENSTTSLQDALKRQEDLGAFLTFLSAAALKPHLCQEDRLTIRGMADALYLSGTTAPTEVLDALEYPRARSEVVE